MSDEDKEPEAGAPEEVITLGQEQKRAQLALARLNAAVRKRENRLKYVLGGMVQAALKDAPGYSRSVLQLAEKYITRPEDLKTAEDFLADLRKRVGKAG